MKVAPIPRRSYVIRYSPPDTALSTTLELSDAQSRPSRPPRFFGFIASLLTWLALAWIIVGALIAPVVPGGWLVILGAAIGLTVIPITLWLRTMRAGRYPGALFRLFVLRTFWYAQVLVILAAAGGVVGALVGLPFAMPGSFGRAAVVIVGVVVLLAGIVGYFGANWLDVRAMDIALPDLPAGLDGLRIAQISDTHVGPHSARRFLSRVAKAVGDARPDIIAVTGDLVDDHAEDVDHYAAAFSELTAPLGVYAIPGNHDVYAGWSKVRERLARLPMRVLVNDAAIVTRGDTRLAIIGTGDPAAKGDRSPGSAAPDIARALDSVPPNTFAIALAHNPALWPALAEHGVPLTLSGHTHWGQLALPSRSWNFAGVFLELSMGMYRRDRSVLYIHPGTGYWGIPFRIGARPQVAVITLRRGA